MRPSFIGLMITGVLVTIAVIYALLSIGSFTALRPIDLVMLMLAFSIAISVHSLQHMGEEMFFHFNPMAGHWRPSNGSVPIPVFIVKETA